MIISDLFKSPQVMAIVNVTPDSFFEGSRVSQDDLLSVCEMHVGNGATILDIGGYSSRPGAGEVSEEEELIRTVSNVELLKKNFPDVLVSIDTFRKNVADQCVKVGADIVNDITGGNGDKGMIPWVKKNRVPYVLMHMRGNPQTMSSLTQYSDVVSDVISELEERVRELKKAGVFVMVDPGFGFAKSLKQNYELLNRLKELEVLDCPILIGVSRKSMIYKALAITPEDSLNGTTILNSFALLNGASVLRVHDTKQAFECVSLFNKMQDN